MKKTLILFAIAAVTLGMASCEKDNNTNAKDLRFTAILEGSEKTSLNDATDDLTWNSSGETITVSNTSGSTNYMATYSATPGTNARIATFGYVSGTLASGVTSRRAFYPANITTDGVHITLPQVQHSTNGELAGYPMYTESENETLLFKNLCAVLKLNLQKNGESVKKIQIVTDKTVNGTFSVNYNDGDPILTPTSDEDHTKIITMELTNAVPISSRHTFNIYIPKNTYNYIQIKVYDNNGLLFTKTTNTTTTFNRSKYKTLSFGESEINFRPSVLNGRFSVSSSETVVFAKSNLFKNGSNYYFLDHQYLYDYSGYDSRFNFTTAQTTSFTVRDGIQAGSPSSSNWKTLDKTEWNYLMNNRSVTFKDESNHNYGIRWRHVKVKDENNNEIGGIILFPDVFYWPLDDSRLPNNMTTGSSTSTDWNGIVLDNDEWIILEDAGCVFLPWTGEVDRSSNPNNTTVINSAEGFYWTTSPSNLADKGVTRWFDATDCRNQNVSVRSLLAIRPVKNALSAN